MTEETIQKAAAYSKMYREKNKEALLERNRIYRKQYPEKTLLYYNRNSDKIKQERKELVHCPLCNYEVTKESMYRHKKSLTHVENVKNLKNNNTLHTSPKSPESPLF